MPDFLNVDTEYPQRGWEESLSYILKSVKAENPDFLMVAGDLVMGHWHNGDKAKPGIMGVEHYADIYYPAWKARMAAHGIKWYAALGDHEIGDNPWRYKDALESVAAYKKEFCEHLAMPLNGPDHMKGTAFWWRHKNVLFVSVDVFEEGKSSQGAIRTGVTGKQLEWLNAVLEKSKDATHKIVMGHAPCLGPVRKWSSSGLMVEDGRESPFWQAMKQHGVDLYLCGEVHAITCTERDGVQQIAHGGLIGYNTRSNYLVVDVHPDRLQLTIKEIDMIPSGPKLWQPGQNRPLEKVDITPVMRERGFIPVGKLTIEKSGTTRRFTNPQGYFLKKFETSNDRGVPVFRNGAALPRVNLDGSSSTGAGLRFQQRNSAYTFDTGVLRGVLKGHGVSWGLSQVTDVRTGTERVHNPGLFSIYRVFDNTTRYGDARSRKSQSKVLPDGGVEYLWPADERNPFVLRAVYRWVDEQSLDIEISVTAEKDLPDCEVFLSTYLKGTDHSYGYARGNPDSFVEAVGAEGKFHLFPRDTQAKAMALDGRWKQLPHPVDWVMKPDFAGALGLRRDSTTGSTALVMANPADCFALSMSHGTEPHHSLYLSLFGRTIKAGETDTARARLVLGDMITDEEAVDLYQAYIGKGE